MGYVSVFGILRRVFWRLKPVEHGVLVREDDLNISTAVVTHLGVTYM
jgi:hypothetical protein